MSTDVESLEWAVERLLAGDGRARPRLLGHGEMTCVLQWRGRAWKRLPPLSTERGVDKFAAAFAAYVARLRERGVPVVESHLESLRVRDGSYRVYCVQPVLPAESMLVEQLGRMREEHATAVFDRVLDHVHSCVDGQTGLDAQLSNWCLVDGEPAYFDLTTPFARDEAGREALDPEIYIGVLPRLIRSPVRLFLSQRLLDRYYSLRKVRIDLLANLRSQRLDHLLPSFLERVNARTPAAPISVSEVRAYRRNDRLTWATLRLFVALEHSWQRAVGGAPTGALLPTAFQRHYADDGYKALTTPGELLLDVKLGVSTRLDRLTAPRAGSARLAAYDGVRTWCIFVGYPRSGHSLVGSLIDAHRHAVISHRLDALRFFHEGMEPRAIFHLILRNSARFAANGRRLTGYGYAIEGMWQGRFEPELRLVGDQEGDKSARWLTRFPELLDRLLSLRGARVRFVHVIRNPYDNIATIAHRTFQPLEQAATRYFRLCEAVAEIKRRTDPADILDIRHEDLVARPEASVRGLWEDLSLETAVPDVRACASVVHPAVSKTRLRATWDPELVRRLEVRAAEFPWLSHYTFADGDREGES